MNLIEGLQVQIARVQAIKKEYESIGNAGAFASGLMALDIDKANKAIASGNTILMIQMHKTLSEYKL